LKWPTVAATNLLTGAVKHGAAWIRLETELKSLNQILEGKCHAGA
jgi:hypothetical protein